MALVETVRGPVDVDSLGTTLMHEHVFVLSEEIRQNYPAGWDEDDRVDDAIAKLNALAARGCQTIVDPTVLGLGRDISRIRRVADGTELNIIVATGLYTYNEVPLYFKYRAAARRRPRPDGAAVHRGHHRAGSPGTGRQGGVPEVRHRRPGPDARASSGCCGPSAGPTPRPARRSRCTRIRTRAPAGMWCACSARRGADLTKVVLGHSGDSTDLDYLSELADAGCLLGMDRFGLDLITPFEDRVDTVAAMCERGYADRMVLSHDASCYIDWFPPEAIPLFAPGWHFEHLFDDVLPALR